MVNKILAKFCYYRQRVQSQFKRSFIPSDLSHIKTIELPYDQMNKTFVPVQFGEGGAISRLRNQSLPIEKRIQALLAINANSNPNKQHILQDVLFDSDDEIRLLAFGLINTLEKELSKKIHNSIEQIKVSSSIQQLAKLKKKLALDYWELIYNQLVQIELMDFTLDKALTYTQDALKYCSKDTDLLVLQGKIYLKQNQLEQALKLFIAAIDLGAPEHRVLPYLAEIYFIKKQWHSLLEILHRCNGITTMTHFSLIIKFWLQNHVTPY